MKLSYKVLNCNKNGFFHKMQKLMYLTINCHSDTRMSELINSGYQWENINDLKEKVRGFITERKQQSQHTKCSDNIKNSALQSER